MKTICVQCKVVMRPRKNGITVVEEFDEHPPLIWSADLMECPRCQRQVIGGFGKEPLFRWSNEGFEDWKKRATHFFNGELESLMKDEKTDIKSLVQLFQRIAARFQRWDAKVAELEVQLVDAKRLRNRAREELLSAVTK